MHFKCSAGGVENTADMLEQLSNIDWMPAEMSVLEFVEVVSKLCTQMAAVGTPMSDGLKLTYILKGIQRSPTAHPDFKADVEWAKRNSMTLQAVINLLQKTDNRLSS